MYRLTHTSDTPLYTFTGDSIYMRVFHNQSRIRRWIYMFSNVFHCHFFTIFQIVFHNWLSWSCWKMYIIRMQWCYCDVKVMLEDRKTDHLLKHLIFASSIMGIESSSRSRFCSCYTKNPLVKLFLPLDWVSRNGNHCETLPRGENVFYIQQI